MSDSRRKHQPRRSEPVHDSSNLAGHCLPAGKRSYPSKSDARRAVRRMRSKPGCEDAALLNAYPCGEHWHIGHRRAA